MFTFLKFKTRNTMILYVKFTPVILHTVNLKELKRPQISFWPPEG